MTEWHVRYGGRGVMIYWHVERQSVCIHSRLKRCSSSEVASMIEGVLAHDTEMEVDRQYVDSHGRARWRSRSASCLGSSCYRASRRSRARSSICPGPARRTITPTSAAS
ncbi:hypothetical protein CAF53_24120 [Sphingobium sp. LB126]|nr:hypothetical protein CAF53_24120 [Sphingobium sp. LB126]